MTETQQADSDSAVAIVVGILAFFGVMMASRSDVFLAVAVAVFGGLVISLVLSSTFRRAYVLATGIAGHAAAIGWGVYSYLDCLGGSNICLLPGMELAGVAVAVLGVSSLALIGLGISSLGSGSR